MKRMPAGKKITTKIKNSKLVEERHEQIFQAASRLIKKKGFASTTLRDLSRETGIGLGNLYDYISTKEDILYIVHEKAIKMIIQAADEKKSDLTDPVDKLKEMITIELDIMDKYQDLILSLYRETHLLSKPSMRSMLKQEEEHINNFKEVLEKGIELDVFKPCNTEMLAHTIKMAIDCWVLRRWALRKKVTLDEMKEGLINMVMGGITK